MTNWNEVLNGLSETDIDALLVDAYKLDPDDHEALLYAIAAR